MIVYRKGRLWRSHEISGIKAPIFLHGWWWGGCGVYGGVWGGDGGVGVGVSGVLVRDVVDGGGRKGGGMGDGVLSVGGRVGGVLWEL